jgi:alpha-D-ribose 1-methylphosphonate 5-triphosphate synthase subunit PhnG
MLDAVQDGLARKAWFAVLARATGDELREVLAAAPALPGFTRLRGPETGMAMVRGRAGGAGAAFNLGEMTVTRCSIRDDAGRVGHAYAAGRDGGQAELFARLDAVLQDPELFPVYHAAVVAPLQAAQAARRLVTAQKAAATDVKFFTLATMRS